ncbi:hypothetical protein VKT23_003141 [Stygiomarasmius scandens]|uniref:3'-5' exonuclease n=1 Tax=Marasmiellus scandens TaxID=2682957 RepID=A0ABR1K0F4_9AGAR
MSAHHSTLYSTKAPLADAHLTVLNSYNAHLGFDIEWRPNFVAGRPQNPVALVQLASDKHTFLVQVSGMRPRFPHTLQQILENPVIPKAGVGIQEDVKKLWNDCGVSVASCVDLSLFARSVDYALFAQRLGPYKNVPLKLETPPETTQAAPESSSDPSTSTTPPVPPSPHDFRLFKGRYRDPIGLARLVKAYHNRELTKGKITRSNWEAPLSRQQIEYAAEDARAGYTVYEHLLALFFTLPEDKRPKRRYYAFDCIQGELYLPLDPDSREPLGHHTVTRVSLVKWSMQNPEYDAGPMPVKKKKEDNSKDKGKEKGNQNEEGIAEKDEDKEREKKDEKDEKNRNSAENTLRSRPPKRRKRHPANSDIPNGTSSINGTARISFRNVRRPPVSGGVKLGSAQSPQELSHDGMMGSGGGGSRHRNNPSHGQGSKRA